jgi:nitroreductase
MSLYVSSSSESVSQSKERLQRHDDSGVSGSQSLAARTGFPKPVTPGRGFDIALSVFCRTCLPGTRDELRNSNLDPSAASNPEELPMPDALQLLTTRRSVKPIEMNGPGPSAEELATLLTVASRVPDHGKLTPWRFIVFQDDARLQAGAKLADIFAKAHPEATADQVDFERKRLARAPLVVAVVSRAAPHVKIPEWEQVLSAGAVAMSLVLAAHALGYAASWITEWYAYDRDALAALGLAANERVAGFVHIGRPARPPEDRPRPPLSEIVTRYGR